MPIVGTGNSFSNDPLSLLDIVVRFCERTGLDVPTVVMATQDAQVRQIRALLDEEGKDLSRRGAWEGLIYEAVHTSIAAENQGQMVDICPNNFRSIRNETIWNRTQRLPIIGPLDGIDWQAQKALLVQGPRYRYRIRNGALLVNPVPVAGETWAIEYVTKNWVLAPNGDGREYFFLDEDVTFLPADLLLQGLRWRWKKEKGLEYAEDFRTYEMQVKDALGEDAGKQNLHMDCDPWTPKPGIWVSPGSWNV
jgi:hypothetical protein